MRKMGTCYSFVSTEKIKDLGAFSRKLEHNFRIGGRVPNADPMKSYLNEELIKLEPGSDYIKEYNKRVLDSAYYQTHKIRKDAVRGIEVMMTFSSKDIPKDFDFEQWKKENVEWLQSYFGKDNVVSAVLHMDETTPHIHAVVIPMVNERLSAAHFLNGRERMANLQNSYGDRMEKLGLTRGMKGSLAKHTDIKEFYTAVNKQKIKELPQPKKHESTKDYYERAQKVFQESNYQHLNELQKKDREIIEKNTQTLQENLELANKILSDALSGENFDTLIEEYSEDTTGGDYCFTAGQLLEEFEYAVSSISSGEIYSEVVETEVGYHIVMRTDITEDYINSHFDDLRSAYLARRFNETLTEYSDTLEVKKEEIYDTLTEQNFILGSATIVSSDSLDTK